jgi:hypothetical protein
MKTDIRAVDEILHFGENVLEKIEEARGGSARSLENAACSLRSTAAHGKDAIESIAESAASRLDSTAKYVRTFHPFSSLHDVMGRNPAITFGIGIVAGVFAAYSLRRS